MPITLKDVATDERMFPDGAPVSVNGTVKVAWDAKQTQYGPQQGFVLVGDDGTEIACQLSGREDGSDFAPVQKGDMLEIYTTPSKKDGRPSGTKIDSYVGKSGQNAGKRVRQIKIYGLSHLRVLNRQVGAQAPQQPAPPPAQERVRLEQSAPTQQGSRMDENAWLLLYGRAFGKLAQFFEPRMPSTPPGGAFNLAAFLEAAPVEVLDIIHRGATSLCIAVQDGKVSLAQQPAPPAPQQEQPKYTNITPGATPDPSWMQDNDGDPGPWSQE